jgi:hypothetical protein
MRTLRLLPILLIIAGCVQYYDPEGQRTLSERGYGISGKEPFRFEVDAALLREWGGANSPKFNQVLEEELARRRICRGGYSLRNETTREGVYSVTGR